MEKKVEKCFLFIAIVFCLTMLACYIAAIFSKTLFEMLIAAWWAYNLFLVLQVYAATSVSLTVMMYKEHRLEFYRHFKSMMLMHTATVVTLLILIFVEVCFMYLGPCFQMNDQGAMYSLESQQEAEQSICVHVFDIVGIEWQDHPAKERGIYIFNFVIVLPIIVFFLLDQPHDCFICLGKDPDRIFSSY